MRTLIILLFLSTACLADEPKVSEMTEPEVVEYLLGKELKGWRSEVVLPSRDRVDLIGPPGLVRAWEVDWLDKHEEGITQAIRYSILTGHRPGLIILIKEKDEVEYLRLMLAIQDLRYHGYDIVVRFYDVNKERWIYFD